MNIDCEHWNTLLKGFVAEECFQAKLNEADWRPCARNHEQQQRVWQLSAGPHSGVSFGGLCAQQDGEDCGSGSDQRRENRYGCISRSLLERGENDTTVC